MSLTEENMLSVLTQFLSYIFSLMFASMISGIVVTIDKSGRVRNTSGQFIGFERAIGLVFLDMIISALLVEFASAFVQAMLIQNANYIVAITSGMFLLFMLWFCHSFSYKAKKHWKPILILVLAIIINIVLANQREISSMTTSVFFAIRPF